MTLCPIAALAGCQKCPVFKLCLVKKWVGDLPETPRPVVSEAREVAAAAPVAKPAARPAARKPRAGAAAKSTAKPAARPRAAKSASKPAA